jgi:hypothetical protein
MNLIRHGVQYTSVISRLHVVQKFGAVHVGFFLQSYVLLPWSCCTWAELGGSGGPWPTLRLEKNVHVSHCSSTMVAHPDFFLTVVSPTHDVIGSNPFLWHNLAISEN